MKFIARRSLTACLTAVALLAAPSLAAAEDLTITEQADGGFTVEGDVAAAIEAKGEAVALTTPFGEAMGEAFGPKAAEDYGKGVLIEGPQTVSIARDDGTAAYYQVDGDIYAFAQADTLKRGDALSSLNGVIVFEAEVNGRLVYIADSGAISLIRG